MHPITIGILSDTHISRVSDTFQQLAATCFAQADIILHAGDLTDLSILSVFQDKEVHTVHGNMCNASSYTTLPTQKLIQVGDFSIGLIHKVGHSYDFEDRLIEVFPEADCIVYGHTHNAVCHQIGDVLYINPGSFNSRGTYALLQVGEKLKGSIHQVGDKR